MSESQTGAGNQEFWLHFDNKEVICTAEEIRCIWSVGTIEEKIIYMPNCPTTWPVDPARWRVLQRTLGFSIADTVTPSFQPNRPNTPHT